MQAANDGAPSLRQSATPGAAAVSKQRQTPANSASIVLLNSEQAAKQVFGCSERKFHKLRNESWFTVAPRALGPRMTRWVRAELEALVLNMPAAHTRQPEPPSLLRGKIEKLKRGVSSTKPGPAESAAPRANKTEPVLVAS